MFRVPTVGVNSPKEEELETDPIKGVIMRDLRAIVQQTSQPVKTELLSHSFGTGEPMFHTGTPSPSVTGLCLKQVTKLSRTGFTPSSVKVRLLTVETSMNLESPNSDRRRFSWSWTSHGRR